MRKTLSIGRPKASPPDLWKSGDSPLPKPVDTPDRLARTADINPRNPRILSPSSQGTVNTVSDAVTSPAGRRFFQLFSKVMKRDIEETRFTGNDANHLFSVS